MLAVIPCQLSLCLPHIWQGPCWPPGLVLSLDPEGAPRKPGVTPWDLCLGVPFNANGVPDITSHI